MNTEFDLEEQHAHMSEQQNMSPMINELAEALSKAQGQMTGAKKDSENPFFKSKYADLASVIEAAREPLRDNGLCVIQTTEPSLDYVKIVTLLAHKSGQWIRGTITLKPTKQDPQGMGSAITYARRYAYAAIVGIAQVDDDGNEASKPAPTVKLTKVQKDAVLKQTLSCLEENDSHGLNQIWDEWGADEKVVLWAMFNSQQRAAMKQLMKGE